MKYLTAEIWDTYKYPKKLDDFITNATTEDFDRIFYIALNDYLYWKPEDKWNTLVNVLTARNKKLEVLVGLSSYIMKEPTYPNVHRSFWDSYWLVKTFVNLKRKPQSTDFKYHYVSLNHRQHHWRCELMDLLAKYDLLKYGAVSWHGGADGMYQSHSFKWKYFKPTVMRLTDTFTNGEGQYIVPLEYDTSFSQLISESNDQVIEISEKTATPLILGKPFLVAGGCHNSKLQTALGFEHYTEIFDYSFDDIMSRSVRYDALVKNFVKLSDIPLSDLPLLHSTLSEKILYNQNRVKEIVFDFDSYPDPIKEIIDIYETTGEIIDMELIKLYRTLKSLKGRINRL
jgi:hypothetical protein